MVLNRSLHSLVILQPKTIGHFTAYVIKYECVSQPGSLVFLRLQLTLITLVFVLNFTFIYKHMHMLYLQFNFHISILYTIHNYYSSHDNLSTGLWTQEHTLSKFNNKEQYNLSKHTSINFTLHHNFVLCLNIYYNKINIPGATHT